MGSGEAVESSNKQSIGAILKINFNLVQDSIKGNKFKTREEFET
jgi:hypothetical protein